MKTLLVTGSKGLIGSEMVKLHCLGRSVRGVDNNMRAPIFSDPTETRLGTKIGLRVNAIALHTTN